MRASRKLSKAVSQPDSPQTTTNNISALSSPNNNNSTSNNNTAISGDHQSTATVVEAKVDIQAEVAPVIEPIATPVVGSPQTVAEPPKAEPVPVSSTPSLLKPKSNLHTPTSSTGSAHMTQQESSARVGALGSKSGWLRFAILCLWTLISLQQHPRLRPSPLHPLRRHSHQVHTHAFISDLKGTNASHNSPDARQQIRSEQNKKIVSIINMKFLLQMPNRRLTWRQTLASRTTWPRTPRAFSARRSPLPQCWPGPRRDSFHGSGNLLFTMPLCRNTSASQCC